MKVIGIEIKSTEAILVVLEKDGAGVITQSDESTKIGITDSASNSQVRQFMQQVKASLDNINADEIALVARNGKAKGTMTPSPFSFKLEGLFQLYDKKDVQFVWPQTVSAFFKKRPCGISPSKKYQENAFNLACYILNK
jgi:hypothetical protein